MADPFGIVGLVGVAAQIIQIGVEFGLDWKDAPADARGFVNELQALKTSLCEMNMNIILNQDFASAFQDQHSAILSQLGDVQTTDTQRMLRACHGELKDLLEDLRKRSHGHRVGWERLKGAFLAKKTRESVESLHRQCQILNSLVAMDALTIGVSTHNEVREAREEQKQWHEAESKAQEAIQDGVDDLRNRQDIQEISRHHRQILDWLTETDYVSQQNDFLERRQTGTGQWLLESAEFQGWVKTKGETLFCPGLPGAGKTILTSIVIEHLQTQFSNDGSVGIAYLFCNFRRKEEQTVRALLTSLLRHLVRRDSSLPKELEDLHKRHAQAQTRPSYNEISSTIQAVAASYSRCFIVVDALDECQTEGGLLTSILELQNRCGANVFVTSRFIPEATEKLRGSPTLEVRAHDEDVRKYIDARVSESSQLVRTHRAEITTGIIKAVGGMFLLAQLHFEAIKSKKTLKKIREVLGSLATGPKAYDRAYEEAMSRIVGQDSDSKELAMNVLSWITCAKRPLSATELRHALSVEVGQNEPDEDNLPQIEDVASSCAGLVTVDTESNIIRLVHYTTQEYFERTQSRWFPDVEGKLATTCAIYLSFQVFESGPCSSRAELTQRFRLYPLYRYAAENWGKHTAKSSRISPESLEFLRRGSQTKATWQVIIVNSMGFSGMLFPGMLRGYDNIPVAGCHLIAYFGIAEAAKALIPKGLSANLEDNSGRTPLSYAAEQGHTETAAQLLAHGAQVDMADNYGWTPLFYAAEQGHTKTIVPLLAHHAQVNMVDNSGRTPIQYTAEQGHTETILELLAYGAQINITDNNGRTPISFAAREGHAETIAQLLAHGAHVDMADRNRRTPISFAAEEGHTETVVQLLTHGAQVDVADNDGWAPISFAAEQGHAQTVAQLLAYGAQIDRANNDGRTPISFAAEEGHERSVEQLLARGAQVNMLDNDGRTPISFAAEEGHEGVVGRLMAQGAQVDIAAANERTALSHAAEQGRGKIAGILLAQGAEVDRMDVDGRTPLSYAVESGDEEAVALLLSHGADVEKVDKQRGTPLSYVSE